MRYSVKFIFLSLVFFLPLIISGQTDSVAYAPGFTFRQGIYLNYQQFRENRPVLRSRIISNYDSTRLDYLRQVTAAKTISYTDSSGKLTEVSPSKIWGFCENNSVYIRYNNAFNKIVVMGSLCHFTATYVSYMSSGPPYPANSAYGTPVETIRQYMLDTKTGSVLDFVLPNVEAILKRDPELYKEFMGLRKGKRKQLMFFYLRKYNERNLLYFFG